MNARLGCRYKTRNTESRLPTDMLETKMTDMLEIGIVESIHPDQEFQESLSDRGYKKRKMKCVAVQSIDRFPTPSNA